MRIPPHIRIALALAATAAAATWIAWPDDATRGRGGPAAGAHDHGQEDARPERVLRLPPQTLRTIGVETTEIHPTTFRRHRAIPARIQETPSTELPVFAPIGGRILEVLAEPGAVVEPGEQVASLLRDPIPRPDLSLVRSVLDGAASAWTIAAIEVRRAFEEKEREGSSREAEAVYGRARRALSERGFSDDQIDTIVEGNPASRTVAGAWREALRRAGFWTPGAQTVHDLLPAGHQADPWAIAALGELAAGALLNDDLVAWLQAEPAAAASLLEIAALLQEGHTVADVRGLHALGALLPIVAIRAPDVEGVPDWDTHKIHVRAGAHLATGEAILTLIDPRCLVLRAEPVGGEQADTLRALQEALPCRAEPLVAGAGPVLDGLRIDRVLGEHGGGPTVAYLAVVNEPLAVVETPSGQRLRTWRLRPGLGYSLDVPTETHETVFVLPSDGVTDIGAEQIVFVRDGEALRAVTVEISYRDHEVAVIPARADIPLKEGDEVVTRGAFALGLALRGGGEVDPHAGHHH